MSGYTECVVTFGAGIDIQWTSDQDGLVHISFRRTGERTTSPGFVAEEVNNNTIIFRTTHHDDIDAGQSDAQNDEEQALRTLNEKITRKWKQEKQASRPTIDEEFATWRDDPVTFLGSINFVSSEQWSWTYLNSLDKRTVSHRSPFHKINLAMHLQRRLLQGRQSLPSFSEANSRKIMLREIYPNYEKLSRDRKKPLWARFERYIKQGNVLCMMESLHPGLLLTAAPHMSMKDLALVYKYLQAGDMSWLQPDLLAESAAYDDMSEPIMQFLKIPQRFRSLSFSQSTISNSLSLPQILLVPEALLRNINVYFESTCRHMVLDNHGNLLDQNGVELRNDLCNDFDSYCFTATMFKEKQLHAEFGCALSKACGLVKKILRAEHPRTLATFFEVFIHLIQTGLHDVSSFLRDFVKTMSAEVLRKGHPWGEIYQLLGKLDSQALDQAMARTWECTTDIFERNLPKLSRLAVSVRLDYVKRVYGFNNPLHEERLLRDLLNQFDGTARASTPRVILNLAHNLSKQGRYDEAEETALTVDSLLQEHEVYANRIAERVECKKVISHSHFHRGNALAAEQTMREALQMIEHYWGKQHSWFLEFTNVLESWLRGWAQEDAYTLQREIRCFLKVDN